MSDERSEWQRWVGVRERQNRHHAIAGTDDTRAVVADEGKFRGKAVGETVHHWDDRVDATAKRFEVTVNPNLVARVKE